MMPVYYITIQQALDTHLLTVKISGGGDTGVINSGQLESVLNHIQNDDYYPTFEDKLTHLVWEHANSIVSPMGISELPSLWERSFY